MTQDAAHNTTLGAARHILLDAGRWTPDRALNGTLDAKQLICSMSMFLCIIGHGNVSCVGHTWSGNVTFAFMTNTLSGNKTSPVTLLFSPDCPLATSSVYVNTGR